MEKVRRSMVENRSHQTGAVLQRDAADCLALFLAGEIELHADRRWRIALLFSQRDFNIREAFEIFDFDFTGFVPLGKRSLSAPHNIPCKERLARSACSTSTYCWDELPHHGGTAGAALTRFVVCGRAGPFGKLQKADIGKLGRAYKQSRSPTYRCDTCSRSGCSIRRSASICAKEKENGRVGRPGTLKAPARRNPCQLRSSSSCAWRLAEKEPLRVNSEATSGKKTSTSLSQVPAVN